MKITKVEVHPIELPLIEPFEIALGTQTAASNLLVVITIEDDTTGYGEGAPIPPVTGDTQTSAISIAKAAADLLVDEPIRAYRRLIETVRSTFRGSPSATLAIEMAILDVYFRANHLPLSALFGGDPRPVRTDITIPIVESSVAAKRTNSAVARGFDAFKIKTGGDVEDDLDRLMAVREAAPSAQLKVDANQGWTIAEAIQFADRCADQGIGLELLEQPVRADDIAGMAAVTEGTKVPVAADETVFTPTDALEVARERAASVINVKLGKSGLIGANAIVNIAQAANLDLMIGCMLESSLAIHAAAHLVGGTNAFSYVDLDSNQLLKKDLIEVPPGPMINPSGPGHGVVPEMDR